MHIGGSQILAIDLINKMCREHEVFLLIVNDQWNQQLLDKVDKRVVVRCINRKEGSRNPLPVLRFNLLLKKIKPDVIHCHENKIINLIKIGKYKTIYTVHDVGVKNIEVKKYSVLVAISKSVKADVTERFGVKAKVIHNGISMETFAKRKQYALSNDKPFKIVQVSRLVHEKKGQDILIKAIDKLVKNSEIQITLDIIGNGPSYNYLQSLIKSYSLERSIKLIGAKDRKWISQNLLDYHVLVQPSRFEGFGLTLIEGIAAGVPVIASDIDGPAEIMTSLNSKFTFESENIDACANKLMEVITLYQRNKIESIMEVTYREIAAQFSLASAVDNYLRLYEEVVRA
ncbi:glycosyltransferase [Segetibacter aerophilus]|nr:glycosyltransferase [Segetibacter aerophilus]